VRIVTFTTCLTIMIRILNITVVKILRAVPATVNTRSSGLILEATVLPENRVGSAGAGNPGSIASRMGHSVASSRCYWYRLSIRNRVGDNRPAISRTRKGQRQRWRSVWLQAEQALLAVT
jgi:hypothetical protein